ncbi:MAG: autotransporter-associated beta strand repeat-containing protein, partial [Akkermansia sp.]|nr:autotransporter-associated beta strand repeat-containing protein [Akkermansia sp.]
NYGGKLTVNGDLVLDSDTAAEGGIELNGGSISGGSIVGTDVVVDGEGDMNISSDITGDSSLIVNGGNVTLSGNNDYTGGTTVNGGNLTIGDGASLGTGDVIINGGTLDLNDNTIGNDITLNNGNLVGGDNYNGNLSIGGDNVTVEGGYTLSAGNVLEIAPGGTAFGSDLTLAGGTLLFKGAPLTVDGEVSFAADTTTLVDLRQWDGQLVDGLTLAVLGSGVEGWFDGCLELIGMSDMSLLFDSATGTLTLQVESEQPIIEVPTITWLGAKNTVWQHGKAGWMNATTGYDAVYENGAEVIFTQSGAVTIAGAVAPGSVIVAGDKAITFKSDKANPGRIVGETSIIKRGNGQLTLNDGNSYTGGTFIEAGTVVAGGAASFGSGAITISGGTLDLKGKAVLNDIALIGAATIKNGKTFGGELVLDGELLKGSTLNIAEKAEIKSGLINGTLSGVGTVTVSGEVSLGATGKLTTNGLEIDGSLAVSSKGLAMNSKTSAITVHEGGSLISDGVINAYSMEINGGSVDIAPIKASSVTLTDSLHLNNAAMMNLNGKLSAKGSVTIEGDSKLILSGALSAKNLTLGSGDIYMTSTK